MIAIIYTLLATHITIICVTLYLHRSQAHKAITFHPIVSNFMRFWLWLTTGMITKQWVAIHRKHHSATDKEGDPHSPMIYGIWNILFRGVYYYYLAGKNAKMIVNFGKGTPDDWIERKVYTPYNYLGVVLMLLIDVLLFGVIGVIVWVVQMIWIPFWAAGVINGVGHYLGYRNGDSKDDSKNIIPWGIIIGGEELHNNHHLDPASAKLSRTKLEFDIGYMYLRVLEFLKLAVVK
jgi:stearoyl-CoA desaturase (delta-9 desaturase)